MSWLPIKRRSNVTRTASWCTSVRLYNTGNGGRRSFVQGIGLGLLALTLFMVLHPGASRAEHPTGIGGGLLRLDGIHPNTGGLIRHSMCSDVEAWRDVWSDGPDVWASLMARAFTVQIASGCSSSLSNSVISQWEYVDPCEPNQFACNDINILYLHTEGSQHTHLLQVGIIYDAEKMATLPFSWRREVAVHEFGHVMSLQDHPTETCDNSNLVMIGVDYPDHTAACNPIPTTGELCAAWSYYDYQTNTDALLVFANKARADTTVDGCDSDIDGDGYTNIQENSIGENNFAWCNIMRADVDSDGAVSITDISAVASYFGQSIPPAPDRYAQDADTNISILDLSAMAAVNGMFVSACVN